MDDPDKQKLDRKLASSEQDYEVQSFAEKYDLDVAEAAAIIKRVGPSRRKLDSYMVQRGIAMKAVRIAILGEISTALTKLNAPPSAIQAERLTKSSARELYAALKMHGAPSPAAGDCRSVGHRGKRCGDASSPASIQRSRHDRFGGRREG